MAWTTTQLLAHIRRVASLPTSSGMAGYTDADLLVHADAVLQGRVAPLVANARDEHAISTVDVAVASGQATVRLPPRVAAGRLRDVTMATADGAGFVSVPRLEPEDAAQFSLSVPTSPQSVAIVVQAGFLRIVPAPTSAMTLRFSYVRTPSTLAEVVSARLVTNIIQGSFIGGSNIEFQHGALTLSGAQDVVMTSNGDTLGDSVLPSSTALGVTTFRLVDLSPMFANASPEWARYVTEGVYLCPAGTTCIVPLPDAVSSLLVYRAAAAVMQAIGDTEAAGRTEGLADRMEQQLVPLLSERIEGEPQVVRPTFQNRGRGNWRW
jgi:hypothetical protein